MIDDMQKAIDQTDYWDARVEKLYCSNFGDDVELTFEEDRTEKQVVFYFRGCYKVNINHVKGYLKNKPIREMTFAQIPYFMQSVKAQRIDCEGERFLSFQINLFPIDLEILCTSFQIARQFVRNDEIIIIYQESFEV